MYSSLLFLTSTTSWTFPFFCCLPGFSRLSRCSCSRCCCCCCSRCFYCSDRYLRPVSTSIQPLSLLILSLSFSLSLSLRLLKPFLYQSQGLLTNLHLLTDILLFVTGILHLSSISLPVSHSPLAQCCYLPLALHASPFLPHCQ